ncbi:hypothetical protein SLEP1_g54380 [Rubroshorea leprosula]|uniref:Uncharacterized protein n=1 Tax=Rubroshorea leprosula TaxID=152421 RepID=A0AAV5MF42_9ROSI|nr:hypothetical protein SLEP1_g54380 [Rubroshorea leprosula]
MDLRRYLKFNETSIISLNVCYQLRVDSSYPCIVSTQQLKPQDMNLVLMEIYYSICL